ncbi:hypothetical protein ACIGZJ_31420 [Kitasatospora sp. NPDC052868]|uniref:hypothetical protein n=1 Tax=Kitasatospora sp. NPDC052868 TaxID=3364060 RepID=UPI0037CAFC0C
MATEEQHPVTEAMGESGKPLNEALERLTALPRDRRPRPAEEPALLASFAEPVETLRRLTAALSDLAHRPDTRTAFHLAAEDLARAVARLREAERKAAEDNRRDLPDSP